MVNIKYPYIGRCPAGTILFSSECVGAVLEKEYKEWTEVTKYEFSSKWDEDHFTNSTHEYLSNTWGVVESKEHAEFIIELAELYGVDVFRDNMINEAKFFSITHRRALFFWDDRECVDSSRKKITIPLPPKAKEWPQVGDKVELGGCNLVVRGLLGDKAWCEYMSIPSGMITVKVSNLIKPENTQITDKTSEAVGSGFSPFNREIISDCKELNLNLVTPTGEGKLVVANPDKQMFFKSNPSESPKEDLTVAIGKMKELQEKNIFEWGVPSSITMNKGHFEGNETVCGKPKEDFVKATDKVKSLQQDFSSEQATLDCKDLDINVVFTGEGAYVLDCITGVEYAIYTSEDYNKVVSAIRLLQSKER